MGITFWADRTAEVKILRPECVCHMQGVERLPVWLKPSEGRRWVREEVYRQFVKGWMITTMAEACPRS